MLFVVFNYIKVVAGNECCNNHSILEQFALKSRKWCLNYFCSISLVIGPENSCYYLNQSDVKLNPITTWSPAFSRAFEKWKNVLFFCKKTVCYFITRLNRDLLVFRLNCPKKSESWHSFKLFPVKRKITIRSFLVGLNREITAPLKRETTSIFYFLWSYIC